MCILGIIKKRSKTPTYIVVNLSRQEARLLRVCFDVKPGKSGRERGRSYTISLSSRFINLSTRVAEAAARLASSFVSRVTHILLPRLKNFEKNGSSCLLDIHVYAERVLGTRPFCIFATYFARRSFNSNALITN
jgi:hypothetical protein